MGGGGYVSSVNRLLLLMNVCTAFDSKIFWAWFLYPRSPKGEGGILFYLCPSVLPSVQDIFRRIFLSNCWWQKSDIWSQASYRYTILWVVFLDPLDSYFLFADLVGFIHIEHICTFFVTFFSATIDGRNLIFGHKLHIGIPYRGKRFLIRQIPTSCLPKSWGIISEH
jgi:hypothetical protein